MLKRLHDLKAPYPTYAYLWYAAMQTRRGMRHLIRVPVMTLDVSRVVVPSHARYTEQGRQQFRTRLARDGRDVVVPWTIQGDVGTAYKLCNRAQAVSHWRMSDDQWNANRGDIHAVCTSCMRALMDSPIGNTINDLRTAQRVASLSDDQAVWERAVATRMYERA